MYTTKALSFKSKLNVLISMFKDFPNPTTLNSLESCKYLWNRKAIIEAVQDLQACQALADQSWFLLMTIKDPGLEAALAEEGSKNVELRSICFDFDLLGYSICHPARPS